MISDKMRPSLFCSRLSGVERNTVQVHVSVRVVECTEACVSLNNFPDFVLCHRVER